MKVLLTVLDSRRFWLWLIVMSFSTIPMWFIGGYAIEVDMYWSRQSVILADCVVVGIVLGSLGAELLRPRMWEWDKIAGRRASVVAASVSFIGIVAPVLLISISNFRWRLLIDSNNPALANELHWVVGDGLFLVALVWILVPFLGGLASGAISVCAFGGAGLVNSLAPSWHFILPLAGDAYQASRWIPSIFLVVVAVGVHAKTRGASARLRWILNADD